MFHSPKNMPLHHKPGRSYWQKTMLRLTIFPTKLIIHPLRGIHNHKNNNRSTHIEKCAKIINYFCKLRLHIIIYQLWISLSKA